MTVWVDFISVEKVNKNILKEQLKLSDFQKYLKPQIPLSTKEILDSSKNQFHHCYFVGKLLT